MPVSPTDSKLIARQKNAEEVTFTKPVLILERGLLHRQAEMLAEVSNNTLISVVREE